MHIALMSHSDSSAFLRHNTIPSGQRNYIGAGRGGAGGGGTGPPNNLRGGGGNIPFGPPIIHPHFPSISM